MQGERWSHSNEHYNQRPFALGTDSTHTVLPLPIGAELTEGLEVWDTKGSSGVWPSWG